MKKTLGLMLLVCLLAACALPALADSPTSLAWARTPAQGDTRIDFTIGSLGNFFYHVSIARDGQSLGYENHDGDRQTFTSLDNTFDLLHDTDLFVNNGFTALEAGDELMLRVGEGVDPWATLRYTIPTPVVAPSAPTNVMTDLHANGDVALIWGAPLDDGGAAIQGYEVQADGGAWQSVGLNNSYLFAGLAKGQTHTLAVRAVNSAGAGPAGSDDVYIPDDRRVPSAPTNLEAIVQSNGLVLLEWDTPLDDGGARIDGYRVRANGGAWEETHGALGWAFRGLAKGQTHLLEVLAYNAIGQGSIAGMQVYIPADDPAPDAPALSASAGDSRVWLAWSKPAGNPDGYRVYRDGVQVAGLPSGDTLSYEDGAVSNDVTYTYYVVAYNAVGDSPYSNSQTVTPQKLAGRRHGDDCRPE